MSLAQPWWLLGCLLLPVIRWLHRGGRHRRAWPVARLGLWSAAAAESAALNRRQPPDPAWRRRALLVTLVLCALANPQWPASQQRITLWVDDSLSLLTREAQGTRLVLGLAQVRDLLAGVPQADVEVRALGDPWRALLLSDESTARSLAAGAGSRPTAPPPAALLTGGRQHWLLTDGADASVLTWPAGMRPQRVVRVGQTRRNVGLRRLAARRVPADGARLRLSIEASNGGELAETRDLFVAVDDAEPLRAALQLDPGASVLRDLDVALGAAASRVRAWLSPADALAEDDGLTLDLSPLGRRRVADDAACPATLRSAVEAHPALALLPADAADAQFRLECGARAAASGAAVLGVRAERMPFAVPGPWLWSASWPQARRIGLERRGLSIAARLDVRPGDEVLLAAGAEPAVVARGGQPARLDVAIDFDALAGVRSSDVPLLVDLLFERLAGERLLDAVAAVERGARASRVVPAASSPGQPASAAARAASGVDTSVPPAPPLQQGVRPLLLAAWLVLLWEVVALVRQWRRLRPLPVASEA